MTSKEPSFETEFTMRLEPEAKSQKPLAQFWQVSWLIALSSLLISLYPIILSPRLAPSNSQSELDRAALMLADEIGRLTVKCGRFGTVGMLDISDGARSQVGLNRLQATLRLDGMIAKQLGYDYIAKLVSQDSKDADRITRELATLERRLAISTAGSDSLGRDSFSKIVQKVLAQNRIGGRLKSLRITLGGLKHSKFGSRTQLPSFQADPASAAYADGDNYKIHVEVPIWQNANYQFYEIAEAPSLITSFDQFTTIPDGEVASVVLIEADFEVAGQGQRRILQRMRSCAIVGASAPKNPATVFMLSFPQGYYSGITCLNDLFESKKYKETAGEWYQACDSDVPGEGHLVRASADTSPEPPNMAAMKIFYHYIFNVGPALVPSNLRVLLNESIGSLQVSSDNSSANSSTNSSTNSSANSSADNSADNSADSSADAKPKFNSGLFKDTGSARFALRWKSNAEDGRKMLSFAFSSQAIEKIMPTYTFPLAVDSSGSLNLPQEIGFDRARVKEFLAALYKTNIAGIESMQIGATIIDRMQTSLDQSSKKMSSLREELRSVKQSIESLTDNTSDTERDKKLKLLQEQAKVLAQSMKDEQAGQVHSQRVKAKAAIVVHNGKEAAKSTYEIGFHMSSFVGKGLKIINRPFRGFLLSRSLAFIPHVNAVDENELYEVNDADSVESINGSDPESWTSPQFQVARLPDAGIYVDSRPLSLYLKTSPLQPYNRPLFVMMSSTDLLSTKNPSLFASRQTPFDNGAIPQSQFCYFAPQCIQTGAQQEVTWSVLDRDLVYSMNEIGGKAIFSLRPRWCLELGMDEQGCPGLTGEIQIRAPIPKFDDSISGAVLQDPGGGPSVALYPPLPYEMM